MNRVTKIALPLSLLVVGSAVLLFNNSPESNITNNETPKKTVLTQSQKNSTERISPESKDGCRHYGEKKHGLLCNHHRPDNSFLKEIVEKKGNRTLEVSDLPESSFKNQLSHLLYKNRKAAQRALNHLMELDVPKQDFEDLFVDRTGELIYACKGMAIEAGATTEGSEPSTSGGAVPISQPPIFNSKPGAPNTIYLDFNGELVSGTAWNSADEVWDCKPYDKDGDPTTFNDSEQTHIANAWKKVAEDYAPFNVNVTTERPAVMDSRVSHVMITPDLDKNGVALPHRSYGGIAYVNVFAAGSWATNYLISWCQPYDGPSVSEVISHEVGHNMGLSHDGNSSTTYYRGHGSGETSWAPIMGASYNKSVTQWSKGDYYDANNLEDDLSILASKLSYKSDDAGNSISSAATLVHSGGIIEDSGLIQNSGETDYYTFTAGAGSITINVDSWKSGVLGSNYGNMDVKLELKNSSGSTVASHNPTGDTDATLTYTAASEGVFYVVVTPSFISGYNNSSTTGYAQYGTLGQYFISGSFTTSGNSAPVINQAASASPSTVEVGSQTSLSVSASDPDGDTLTYTWAKVSGPGTVNFSNASAANTQASFSTAGSYSLRVTVSDGSLSTTSSVNVNVTELNLAPVIDVAASASPSTLEIDNQTTLTVTASDPNGDSLSYSWTKVNGPGSVSFSNSNSRTTTASFTEAGTYSLRVSVSDGSLSTTSSVNVNVTLPEPDQIVNETGIASISQTSRDVWQTVNLTKTFNDPVILFSPLTYNGADQAHIRVRNVTGNSFQFKIEEWDHLDGVHGQESVKYAVLEAGVYNLSDGRVLEAGNTTAKVSFQTVSLNNVFAQTPVIITQITSETSTKAGSSIVDNVTTTSFDVKVLEERVKGKNQRQEIISYIAIEPGTYEADGIQEGGIRPDSVDNNWYSLQFNVTSPANQIFLASLQKQSESYLVDLRIRNLSTTGVEIKADQGVVTSNARGGKKGGGGGGNNSGPVKKSFGYIILNL